MGLLRQKRSKEILIIPTILLLHTIILFLPYWLNGYKPPVGWDTPIYILNVEIIENKGLYAFFQQNNQILFYSISEYFISTLLRISPIVLETFLPLIMGASLTLINYLIIKELYNSKKLEILVLIFSILNVNTMRLVCDLHRNLFCLILVEIALFLILPKYLREPTKMRGTILILLLVLAGISQMETFFIATGTLFCLFLFSLSVKSFNRAKHLSLIAVAPPLLVILINTPFLSAFLSKHMVFNPAITSPPAPKVEDYIEFLGGPLIPLYLIGLYLSIERYRKKQGNLHLSLFVWNILLLTGSFLPFFGVIIPSWRFLLLTTVPIMLTIGLTILSRSKNSFLLRAENPTQTNKVLMVSALILLAPLVSYVVYTPRYLRPWISNEAYEKLTWISTLNRTDPSIFVIYFNHGPWTYSYIDLYNNWIKAILGPNTGLYFGQVDALLLGLPTPCSDEKANRTSYGLWQYVSSLNVNESDIYLIDDWYPVANQTILVEIYPGIYKVVRA